MDTEFLSRMIRELMLSRDSLSLPGLGTFVAEDMPASFSDRGYTINPPYRRLDFSASASADTCLLDLYAESNPQAPEEAKELLRRFLSDLAVELKEQKSVDFPGLGRLRATRDNHLFFVAEEGLDISPDAFGLGSVSLKTHSSRAIQLPPSPKVQEKDLTDVLLQKTVASDEPLESAPAPAPETTPASVPVPARKRPVLRHTVFAAVCAAAALLCAFVALSRIAPDFTDKLLYTQEELEIINYPADGLGLPR